MSRILLRDLEPGRLYYVQARATNGDQSSQWSQLFDLQTTSDIMAPATVTSLSWVVEGTAFKATWAGPTTNQDGTSLRDFKDFQVKVFSPADTGTVATYYTAAARFDFPFESNFNALGTPRAQVTIEVRARDNTGNLSVVATATTSNPAPGNVTGFTATGISDAISLKWNANSDNDLKYYRVYQGTSFGAENTLVYTGLATNFVFDTISTSPQYFKVVAADVFGTESVTPATANATARSTLSVDTTPPSAPTGVTVSSALDSSDPSGGRAYIDVSWSAVAATDLQNYSVRYSTGTDWQYIDVPEGVLTTRINGLRPDTAYNVAVAAVDFAGNSSSYANAGTYPITTAEDTTAPAAPTGVTVGAGVTTMTVLWTENTEGDVAGGRGYYEIQLDTVNTFNSINLVTKQNSGTIVSFSNLTSNTTYYTRVRAIDASGNAGSYSSIVNGTPRYIANADIQAGTINGDRITAATINGDRVIANSLDANTIKANTTFTQNLTVGSTFTMGTGGIMSSSNYSAGVAGWRLTETSLEINGGTIRAAALQLQSGHNMLHPAYADFEFLSTWYSGKILTSTPSGTLTATIVDTVTITPKYGSQCLRIVRSGGTAGDDSDTWLGASSSSYNVPVEQSTTYIFSVWIHNSTTAKNIQLKARSSDGTFRSFDSMTSRPANGAWTRYSGTLTTGAYNAITIGISTETDGTFYCDGLQLEPQFAGSTSPSTWKPPSQTIIDGGIIRTGEIRSSAAADGLAGQPAWSINVAGNAQLGDVNVRGRLVVGDPSNPSADGVNSRIYSANYSAGTAGWIVRNDGFAEFNDVTIRGTVQSPNYVAGTTGWQLTAAGAAELNNVTIRGSGSGNSVIVGPSGGQQVRLGSTGSSGFVTLTTGRPIELAFSAITSSVGNSGAANEYSFMQILGPTVTGATGQVTLRLNSQNNDGTSNANASMNFGSGNVIIYDKDQMSLAGPVLYLQPSATALDVIRANAAGGHTGNLLELQQSSADRFVVDIDGNAKITGDLLLNDGATVYRNKLMSTATVANTSAETVVATMTIPASDMVVGAVYRITLNTDISFLASATMTWRVRYGGLSGTTLATMGPTTASGTGQTNKESIFIADVMCTAIGSSGNVTTMTSEYRNWTQTGSIGDLQLGAGLAVVINTTTQNDLVVTADWGAASASNTLTAYAICERIA